MKKQYTRKQISEAISHWKKILEDIDGAPGEAPGEAPEEETIKIPSTPSEEEDFIKWADSKLGGSAYDKIVSDKPVEVEGAQRDLDDFDLYEYS